MRRVLTVLVCVIVVIGSLVWFVNKYLGIEAHAIAERLWPSPTTEQLETRKLREIAGWFSINCGHIRRHQNSDVAISCATNALTARKPFYISFDFIGFDSTGIIGLAANRSGKVFQVTTDQLGRGAFAATATSGPIRKMTVARCEKPPVEETSTSYPVNHFLSCRTTSD